MKTKFTFGKIVSIIFNVMFFIACASFIILSFTNELVKHTFSMDVGEIWFFRSVFVIGIGICIWQIYYYLRPRYKEVYENLKSIEIQLKNLDKQKENLEKQREKFEKELENMSIPKIKFWDEKLP